MGRVGIYLKDKIEREVRDIVLKDLQNGANPGEANISATCNELIRLGLLVYKRDDDDGHKFDLEGYRRDLIRKVAGSREGTVLIATLLGNDSNLLIVFYVQIMPDDFVMQLHRF